MRRPFLARGCGEWCRLDGCRGESDEIGADAPEACGYGLAVAAVGGSRGLEVNEVATGQLLEFGGGGEVDRRSSALCQCSHERPEHRDEEALEMTGVFGSEGGADHPRV
jgi:hypothetical protein